jgi:hypothetical protein
MGRRDEVKSGPYLVAREGDGSYGLFMWPPIKGTVAGSDRTAMYGRVKRIGGEVVGEPVGLRHLCPEIMERMIGRDLPEGWCQRVILKVERIGAPFPVPEEKDGRKAWV